MLSSHISSASRTVTRYLDTGAPSNAVPVNSPIIYNVHGIPSREVIGIGQQESINAKQGFYITLDQLSVLEGLQSSTTSRTTVSFSTIGPSISSSLSMKTNYMDTTIHFHRLRSPRFISSWIGSSMADTTQGNNVIELHSRVYFTSGLVMIRVTTFASRYLLAPSSTVPSQRRILHSQTKFSDHAQAVSKGSSLNHLIHLQLLPEQLLLESVST